MKFNFLLLFIYSILLISCSSAPVPIPDTDVNRLAMLEEYYQAVPPEDLYNDIFSNLANNLPEGERDKFIKQMKTILPLQTLTDLTTESMMKHFTANEIRAMTEFYSTTEGKSVMKKMGVYTADVMPKIQDLVMKAMRKYE